MGLAVLMFIKSKQKKQTNKHPNKQTNKQKQSNQTYINRDIKDDNYIFFCTELPLQGVRNRREI